VSIVVPVYNEGHGIIGYLQHVLESVTLPCEILVVYDTPSDTTVPHLDEIAAREPRIRPTLNGLGVGPANAIHSGILQARAPVSVVTMADGSDDAMQIDELTRLVERGVVVAAASRYSKTGQQVGGPALKATISRLAGLTLHWFARVGTRDATNSFKAYSTEFVRRVGILSDQGFEIGIELVSMARRSRLPVAEIPTIWLDRTLCVSNFKLWAWLPRYVHWYAFAFGPRQSIEGFVAGPVFFSEEHRQ
jgi:glycosyltransferase involved in cell wall biosynthesis